MAKQSPLRKNETTVSVRLPRKLGGKKLVLIEAEEYERLKRKLGEVEDALGKIARGNTAHREGRTKSVRSLSELGR